MSIDKDLRQMADTAAAGQAAAMAVLLAEMRALSSLMPGATAPAPDETVAEAAERHRATEAAVEAQFDNMPV